VVDAAGSAQTRSYPDVAIALSVAFDVTKVMRACATARSLALLLIPAAIVMEFWNGEGSAAAKSAP